MMKSEQIKLKINGKEVIAKKSKTLLDILKENGITVPTLCYHPDLDVKANCRICSVEIKGKKSLITACSTKAQEGMEIFTGTERVLRARKANLELIFAQHREECPDCIWRFNCQLLKLAREYKVNIRKYADRKTDFPVYQFGPALIFDSSKCIDCRNCVEMCQKQGVCFLELEEKKDFFQVVPSKNKKKDCVYCGQCIVHCPVGSFEAVGEFENIEDCLKQKNKKVVFQIAPSIRTSIGEEFNMAPGSVVMENLVGAIKKLGVYRVFDTSVGADFTTMEEAEEIIKKKAKGETPCFSSCCPAWVKYLEFNRPDLIPNIASTRSPQLILGGLIKNYWARKENLDPKDIIVVSVMPCVAKKYEVKRKELEIEGIPPVDYVLTTRELAYLLIKYKIDLKSVLPQKIDNPLGISSGAGVIYGASGGVMESVLRTAYYKLAGGKLSKIEFCEVRGQNGVKRAEVKIGGESLRVAVVNGLGEAKAVLEELKNSPNLYDGVEVMACPGGCIGGGGQPVPNSPELRKMRAEALYGIDERNKIRFAHENPIIEKVYGDFLGQSDVRKKICHTKYFKKKKEVVFKNNKK